VGARAAVRAAGTAAGNSVSKEERRGVRITQQFRDWNAIAQAMTVVRAI
jgi:hypothetical protein